MYKLKATNNFVKCVLVMFLSLNTSVLLAQKIVDSGAQSAGFRFSTDETVTQLIIHYQQNIQMLSGIDDRPSLKVYGSGRVVVHFPVYMKKAGDYEMQLDDEELVDLIQSLSSNGVMDFDEKKIKRKLLTYKKALKAKGQFYEVSDAVETVIDIRLDEFQKNKTSKKLKKFHKRFKWKNIEHDAARYKNESEIKDASKSVVQLRALMKDARLDKKGGR